MHQSNPQYRSSSKTTAKEKKKKKKKKPESPPPLKQSTRNLSLGYTEIEKRRALGQDIFLWFVIGLFETLICATAEYKFCDMVAALSVPEHCLSFYFVCDGDDQIQISCAVWLHKMENLAVTFCYLWLAEKLWLLGGGGGGGTAPQSPPLKH